MSTLAIAPATDLELRSDLDFATQAYAYCRWKAEGLFPEIFPGDPDIRLVDFLNWNCRPSMEAVGCYYGEALVGMAWINRAKSVDEKTFAEVGAGFFRGTSLTLWKQALDLMLYHAFVDLGFDGIYGVCLESNRAAQAFVDQCGMVKVERLPWGEEVEEGASVYMLDKERWEEREI